MFSTLDEKPYPALEIHARCTWHLPCYFTRVSASQEPGKLVRMFLGYDDAGPTLTKDAASSDRAAVADWIGRQATP